MWIFLLVILFKEINLYMLGEKFPTNWFVRNVLQLTYKNDMCHLNM